MQKNIGKLCTKILGILNTSDERMWADVFKYLLEELEIKAPKEMAREILKIYQGMGSFNDLILYKNGVICFEETVAIDKLRKELFEEVKILLTI
jgi:hypothetical protein